MSPAGRRSAQAGAPDRVHEQPRRRALVDIRRHRRRFPRVSPFLSFFENSQKGTVMSPAPSAAVRTFPRIGVKATRKATVIAFLAWLFAVYDYILFGTLLPEIAHRFGWTEATASLVSTLVSVGTAIVAPAVRPIVDRIGRTRGIARHVP